MVTPKTHIEIVHVDKVRNVVEHFRVAERVLAFLHLSLQEQNFTRELYEPKMTSISITNHQRNTHRLLEYPIEPLALDVPQIAHRSVLLSVADHDVD